MNAARVLSVGAVKTVRGKKSPVFESFHFARVLSVRWSSTEVPGITKTTRGAGHPATTSKDTNGVIKKSCGDPVAADDEEEEMEEMFVSGPAGVEWGGPTRGGRRPEPTRYGDWERKGRASDF